MIRSAVDACCTPQGKLAGLETSFGCLTRPQFATKRLTEHHKAHFRDGDDVSWVLIESN
jgi:hypothetical protein